MSSVCDFTTICRVCAMAGDLKSLFSKSNTYYSVMLMAVAGVQIMEEDELPTKICLQCLETLESAYTFRQKAQETDIKLKSLQNIKSAVLLAVKEECQAVEEQSKDVNFTTIECDNDQINDIFKKYDFKKHKKNVLTSKECNVCRRTFKQFYKLRSHMRTHTKEKPYVCQECGLSFSLGSNLSRHRKTHTGERPHKCDVCGKGFIQSTSLTHHQRIHTGERPYKCLLCAKSFINRQVLNVHVRVHNPNKTIGRGRTIRRLKQMKETNSTKINENIADILYPCNLCERNFVTKGGLKTHYLTHGDKKFLCSHCGKNFTTKGGLHSHIKTHTGEKPYTCSVCTKSFSHYGMLQEHTRIHTGERPHQCEFCNKSFVQSSHLRYHVRTHTGEKPYKCSVCAKQFTLNGTLTVHMRTHTGETPYICSVCGKGFYDSSSMKKHKSRHSVEKVSKTKC